jgi:hypothetical protein
MDIEADDIGADLKAAFAEHAEAAPNVETALTETKPAVKVDDAGRVRDEHGKFATKTKDEEAASEAAAATKDLKATIQTPEPKAQEAVQAAAAEKPQAIRPPASWSPEAKAAFLEAPQSVQQAMLKRNEEMEEGQKQWSTKAESFNRLDKVLAPHRDRWALNGVSEDVAVAQLLAAQNMLDTKPYEAIQYLARSYNVDLRRLVAPTQGQPANGQQPQGQQFDIGQHPVVQQLTQQVQTLTQTLSQRQQAEEAAHTSAVQSEITKFSTDPEHIYFENVRAKVAALLRADGLEGKASPQERLKAAYDEACWATPNVRALMQAAEAKKKADAAKVKDAKNASGSVAGTPIGGKQARNGASSDDLENDIREAVRAHA